MGTEIASLFARIGADVSGLTTGLANARNQLTGTANSFSASSMAIGTALGNLAAQGISALGNATMNLGRQALDSFASYERLGMSLESMVAKELARGQTSIQTSTRALQLTAAEIAQIGTLSEKLQDAGLKIAVMKEKYEAAASAGTKSAAELAVMADNIADLEAQMGGWQSQIDGLNSKNGQLVNVMTEVVTGQMSMKDALAQAGPVAKDLIGWIQQLAIVSPFSQEHLSSVLKTALAYDFTVAEAKRLTTAVTDFAAGTGAAPDMMNRIALALGQIHAKGKLSGQEILQLTEAGIGVNSILKGMGFTLEDVGKGLVDANAFTEALTSTLENDFGGAAERQAGTFSGLLSSLQDLKTVGLREFFTGTLEAIQPHLQGFVSLLSNPATMEQLRGWGTVIGTNVAGALEIAGNLMDVVTQRAEGFFAMLRSGKSPMEAARIVMLSLIPPEFRSTFDAFAKPFIAFVDNVIAALPGLVGQASDAWATFGGIFKDFAASSEGTPVIGGLMQALSSLISGDMPGALEALKGSFADLQTALQPSFITLGQLVTWLAISLPTAIQTLAIFWNGTLLPAFTTFGTWVQTNVLPALSQLATWLQTDLPAAIQSLSAWLTGTFIPAMVGFATAIVDNKDEILGFFTGLAVVVGAAAIVALPALITGLVNGLIAYAAAALAAVAPTLATVAAWAVMLAPLVIIGALVGALGAYFVHYGEKVLGANAETASFTDKLKVGFLATVMEAYNTLVMLGEIIKTVVINTLTDAGTTVETIGAIIGVFVGGALTDFSNIWTGINQGIQSTIGWLGEMAAKLAEIVLPDWMTPGSPTPWENGLRGVASALRDLNSIGLPNFDRQLSNIGAGMPMGTMAMATATQAGPVYNETNHITIKNEAAMALWKDRRRLNKLQRANRLMA